jgi:UDP-glucose 4-epimerase
VFNVACGQTTDLTTLWNMIKDVTKATSQANYGPNRNGDIMFSLANIENAKKILGYMPDADIKKQMESTISDYKMRYFNLQN